MNEMSKEQNVKAHVRGVLDQFHLGPACIAEHAGEVHVFLAEEPTSNLSVHLATSDLERLTGKAAQISVVSSLSPAERKSLLEVASAV